MIIDLSNVPNKPGIYQWLDINGDILYIGKAKDLKKRMNQYFKGMENSYKTKSLVDKIHDFKYIITSSEKEALLLERNLIEKHLPIFNIKLTDNKRYPYIRIKLNKKLEVSLSYRYNNKGKNELFFGPFPAGTKAKSLTELIQRLTTYEKGFPSKNTSKIFWEEKYKYAKKLLSPENGSLIRELKKEMIDASNNQQYELARNIKDSLEALNSVRDAQNVEFLDRENIDVIAFSELDDYLSITILFYRMGNLLSKRDFLIEIVGSKTESIDQFIAEYYKNNMKPKFIISNEKINSELKVINPIKGKKLNVLNIAIENANDNLSSKVRSFKQKVAISSGAVVKLSKVIGIKKLKRIIMIDNSNTNNTYPVSAIVSYVDGIKRPNEYRKYSLETLNRKADVDYMEQGLKKYFNQNKNNIDLLIVDGGIAQINAALSVLPKEINVIGLVKDDKHKTSHILSTDGKKISIDDRDLYNFLSRMQIEVDRFAKSFHASKRRKTLEGELRTINGLGPVMEKKLLNHFKTYSKIYNASIEELSEVIPINIAKKLKNNLK